MTPDGYFVCATPRTGSSLLLGLLEVRAAGPIVPRHRRQADDLNRAWIARYSGSPLQ